MMDYTLTRCELLPELLGGISPNFIYNRFDLWKDSTDQREVSLWHYRSANYDFFYEVLVRETEAKLGLWLTPLDKDTLSRIVKAVFRAFPQVSIVKMENVFAPTFGLCLARNHFRIELPDTEDALAQRLSSKGRYNLKREKRILSEKFGSYRIDHYAPLSQEAEDAWRFYFINKERTYGTTYNLDAEAYCRKYHVTDIYTLLLDNEKRIAAVFLSCEQCPIAYLENLTYDPELYEYSPGQILYDEYLKLLIKQKVKGIFLLGGDYSYKKRYGSIEDNVFNCTVYRNPFRNTVKWAERKARSLGHMVKTAFAANRRNQSHDK